MQAIDVKALYTAATAAGVTLWIDGGWGVDALLSEETRPHDDLDVVIREDDLTAFLELLQARGYREVRAETGTAWNFVMGDAEGHEVDLHVIVPDAHGNGIYGPPENGLTYPRDALAGSGVIAGLRVRCVSASFQVASRQGYALRAKDYADLEALEHRFGLRTGAPTRGS